MSTHDVALSYSLVHADANPPQGDSASGIAKVSSADNPPTGPVVELQCIGCEDGARRRTSSEVFIMSQTYGQDVDPGKAPGIDRLPRR
ncbi:hypothetical protein V6N13_051212 [Hibiscus sabdariffa]